MIQVQVEPHASAFLVYSCVYIAGYASTVMSRKKKKVTVLPTTTPVADKSLESYIVKDDVLQTKIHETTVRWLHLILRHYALHFFVSFFMAMFTNTVYNAEMIFRTDMDSMKDRGTVASVLSLVFSFVTLAAMLLSEDNLGKSVSKYAPALMALIHTALASATNNTFPVSSIYWWTLTVCTGGITFLTQVTGAIAFGCGGDPAEERENDKFRSQRASALSRHTSMRKKVGVFEDLDEPEVESGPALAPGPCGPVAPTTTSPTSQPTLDIRILTPSGLFAALTPRRGGHDEDREALTQRSERSDAHGAGLTSPPLASRVLASGKNSLLSVLSPKPKTRSSLSLTFQSPTGHAAGGVSESMVSLHRHVLQKNAENDHTQTTARSEVTTPVPEPVTPVTLSASAASMAKVVVEEIEAPQPMPITRARPDLTVEARKPRQTFGAPPAVSPSALFGSVNKSPASVSASWASNTSCEVNTGVSPSPPNYKRERPHVEVEEETRVSASTVLTDEPQTNVAVSARAQHARSLTRPATAHPSRRPSVPGAPLVRLNSWEEISGDAASESSSKRNAIHAEPNTNPTVSSGPPPARELPPVKGPKGSRVRDMLSQMGASSGAGRSGVVAPTPL
eukprot:GFYU01015713.1.p1 GENE.GFYU01015713.1~~GFYU01015713.1.p1  ORF type:complete len:622 (-),score=102.98 GFYU01015713.1:162-2027(-)